MVVAFKGANLGFVTFLSENMYKSQLPLISALQQILLKNRSGSKFATQNEKQVLHVMKITSRSGHPFVDNWKTSENYPSLCSYKTTL